jgi:hypothetical protein
MSSLLSSYPVADVLAPALVSLLLKVLKRILIHMVKHYSQMGATLKTSMEKEEFKETVTAGFDNA